VDGLSLLDDSLLGGVEEVHEVGVSAEAELDLLLLGQELAYVPVTHNIIPPKRTTSRH
jgi:hypothetical protein